MIGLLLLAFPVLEIWSLFFVGGRIGFANTVFALLAAGVLGFGLIRAQGVFLLASFQSTLAKGQVPTAQIFFSLLTFLGGVLFIIPGFLSDVIALILILPGSRNLVAAAIRARIAKKMRDGSFRAASFGKFGGFAGGFGNFGAGPRPGGANPVEDLFRDVSPKEISGEASDAIIDVTPVESSSDSSADRSNKRPPK